MRRRTALTMSACAALAVPLSCAWAQEGAAAQVGEPAQLDSVVVTGLRASLRSARAIKRDSTEIVDAVVADDINKLPDFSVSDALQRVTGVQIGRDRGEATAVVIRGLSQFETTLNGREVFTAGTGRTLDFSDVPAEMVSAILVYKTTSADRIEGGIGGSIDLRTRRPFDFDTATVFGSARMLYGDLAERTGHQYSALLSGRWTTPQIGEFGALLDVSTQKRAWREDQKSVGNPVVRSDLIAGTTVIARNGTSETTSIGERQRDAGSLVLQWRPSTDLDLYAEAHYAEFSTLQDSYQFNASASSSFAAGSPVLYPGSNDLMRVTWTNAPVSVLSFARDTVDRDQQGAIGGSWRRDALTVRADYAASRSHNNLFFSGPTLSSNAANFSQDTSGTVPATQITGSNLLDPASYRLASMAYRVRPFDGDLHAARIDIELERPDGVFDMLAAGVRHATRTAGDAPGTVFGDAAVPGTPLLSALPGSYAANPYPDFLPGTGAASIGSYLVGNLANARDPALLRSQVGITGPLPTAGNPLGVWSIDEQTDAAYALAHYALPAQRVDGNAGLRIVRTRETVDGAQSVPSAGGITPIRDESSYTDALPSAHLRVSLDDEWSARVAAAKTLTRPNFDQLSPSLTLVPNTVNPALNVGSAGNPDLRPVRADNLDLSFERVWGRANAMAITGFYKRVDGFVTTIADPEFIDGATYMVSRPHNADTGHVQGLELAWQQFFDFLPGWARNLGLQANYTYVDSRTPSRLTGGDVPLQNLSRHSANLVGIYETGALSARLAYNWRSRYLSSISSFTGVGAWPLYVEAYGWLDGSIVWRVDRNITLALEGTNLTRTLRRADYGSASRPYGVWLNDRQIGITAALRF